MTKLEATRKAYYSTKATISNERTAAGFHIPRQKMTLNLVQSFSYIPLEKHDHCSLDNLKTRSNKFVEENFVHTWNQEASLQFIHHMVPNILSGDARKL